MCFGPMLVVGQLGKVVHTKCRNCGFLGVFEEVCSYCGDRFIDCICNEGEVDE